MRTPKKKWRKIKPDATLVQPPFSPSLYLFSAPFRSFLLSLHFPPSLYGFHFISFSFFFPLCLILISGGITVLILSQHEGFIAVDYATDSSYSTRREILPRGLISIRRRGNPRKAPFAPPEFSRVNIFMKR